MIRPYQSTDKEALIALLKLNIPDYFDPSEEADFIHYLDHELEDYFVVEEEGELLGSGGINYKEEQKTAYISWDLFHPKAQGRGLGSQLTQFRISRIKAQKTSGLIIVRTSQLAYGFYEKMGFKLVKVEKDFWAQGFDLYQMEISL